MIQFIPVLIDLEAWKTKEKYIWRDAFEYK